jgi:CRP-like cAMP-binding protein
VKDADRRTLSKGAPLYGPGDDGEEVYLVREGYIRLTLPGLAKGSSERTVSVALPWEICGDEALSRGHRRYGAMAGIGGTVVHALPSTKVLRALKTARKSLDAYLDGVERELHRLRHAQGGSKGPSSAQRLAEVLLDLADRCGERVGRGIILTQRLTHQVLADLSGSHRATVTTLLNDWLYDDILDTEDDGCIVIARPGELLGLAGYHGGAGVDPEALGN